MLNKKLLGSVSSLPSDDNFENVSLLLSGDGTNGAQNNTFLDSSTNNFTITRNGNTTQGSFSPYGSNWSNFFNNSSYLKTPTSGNPSFGTGDFTFECWFNQSGRTNGMSPINQLPSSTDGAWRLSTVNGSNADVIELVLRSGGNWISVVNVSVTWGIGTWNHIAISKQSGTIRAFANGVLVATVSDSRSYGGGSFPVYLGYIDNSGLDNVFFNGYVSNARLTTNAVYTSAFTPNSTPLTAISGTVFLSAKSNRFVDNSTSNLSLAPTGTPSVQRFSPFNPTAPYSTSVIGGSGYFDGSGDYLQSTATTISNFGTGNFTFEAWIYPTAVGGTEKGIYDGRATNGSGTSLIVKISTGSKLVVGNPSDLYTSSATIVANTWYHIAIARSGTSTNQCAMFINGVRDGTFTSATNFDNPNSLIGAFVFTPIGVGPYSGYISNMRIVKGTAVYDPASTTITVPTAPVTAITNTSLLCNFTNAGIPDLAMQNNLETVGNAQVSTSVKKYGTGSLAFDGTGDYLISRADTSIYTFGTGAFTIEFWVYFNSISGNPQMISFNPTSTNGAYPLIYIGGSNKFAYYVNNDEQITGTTTPATSTWYHVAICRSGTSTRLFVNGTQEGSTYSDSNNYLCGTNRPVIGSGGFNLLNPLNGYIDDLRITKGVARYTANFTPPASALPSF